MRELTRDAHDRAVDAVVEDLIGQGFEIRLNPSSESLPAFFEHFRPELIARRGEESVAVVVRTGAESIPIDRLTKLAFRASEEPGWRLLLATGRENGEAVGIEAGGLIDTDQIRDRVARSDALRAAGEMEASFVLLWTVFEALARRRAEMTLGRIEGLTISVMTKHLYSLGEIDIPQFDEAIALLPVRNRLVHGFAVDDLPRALESLRSLVAGLIADWATAPTAGSATTVG